MSKFTEQDVKDIAIDYADYYSKAKSIVDPSFDYWWTEKNKPAEKIIDMSHFIKSGIDCEFSRDGTHWHISALTATILEGWTDKVAYYSCNGNSSHDFKFAKPRMNHKMYHDGGECPLPEGFKVAVSYGDDWSILEHSAHKIPWYNIVAYEVLGLADGWSYPWEEK